MKDDLKELINDWFADCTTVEEVAELYSDIKMNNQKQMEFMMKCLTNNETEEP